MPALAAREHQVVGPVHGPHQQDVHSGEGTEGARRAVLLDGAQAVKRHAHHVDVVVDAVRLAPRQASGLDVLNEAAHLRDVAVDDGALLAERAEEGGLQGGG